MDLSGYSVKYILLLLAFATGLIILIGCAESTTDPAPSPIPPMLEVVEMDSIWVLNSTTMRRVSVKVASPSPVDGRSMTCRISGEGVSTSFRLYDDGGHGKWDDAPGFADNLSGDLAPSNAVFSRRINARFTNMDGEYFFSFTLDGGSSDTAEVIVTVRSNSLPVVEYREAPDSILSGREGLSFYATVTDSDGIEDIVSVLLINERKHGSAIPMTSNDNIHWKWRNTFDVCAGLPTGSYGFHIQVADLCLDQVDEYVESDSKSCWLENLPPEVSEVVGPDTVWLPAEGDTNYFAYTIIVSDDQGPTDLDSLILVLSREDTVIVWDTTFFYFDDGTGIDSIASDRRYSAGFRVGSHPGGLSYTFAWTPTDRSPQRGETFYTTLIFVEHQDAVQAVRECWNPAVNPPRLTAIYRNINVLWCWVR